MADLVGGQVDLAVSTSGPAVPQLQTGRIRALGVSRSKRVCFTSPLRAIAQDAFPSINDTFARVLADWHQTTQQFAIDSKLERVWIQQLLAWVSGSLRHAGRDCQVP